MVPHCRLRPLFTCTMANAVWFLPILNFYKSKNCVWFAFLSWVLLPSAPSSSLIAFISIWLFWINHSRPHPMAVLHLLTGFSVHNKLLLLPPQGILAFHSWFPYGEYQPHVYCTVVPLFLSRLLSSESILVKIINFSILAWSLTGDRGPCLTTLRDSRCDMNTSPFLLP